MDKIFNLKIDTKNKNITTVTGFKEFDNNSVLNIILLQNSLALDLSNCTVRINFLREDKRVLLYMADIVSAKEGKVSVKLSPEVLKKTGNVKADISVFDSNLLKITSATFNLKVEKSICDDTYFTEKDLDLMQQEYVREKDRQKAESARSENELERITKEGQRNSNENTRNYNEEARKKAESARVAEWNNIKKDATNIKNTLDTTIDTANTANNNLKNTIATGDKLKQELTPQNYITNEKYSGFEKKTTSQYEDTTNKLNNFGGRNYLLNSSFANGFDNWGKNAENEQNTIKINEQNNVVITNKNTTTLGIHYNIKNIEKGIYTLSIEAKSNMPLEIMCGWSKDSSRIMIEKSNEFKTYSVILKKLKENQEWVVFYTNTPSVVKIKNVKLERGQIATDWTLAPEEIVANSKRLDDIEKILIDKGYMKVTQNL